MWVHARFVAGAMAVLPMAPLLLVQGRRVRASVPSIPEAREPDGTSGDGVRAFRLLALGESTVAGVGVMRHAEGLTGHLADRLAQALDATISWHVHARNGVTARVVADELVPAAAHISPDLVVVGLGANDTFQVTPTWAWRRDVRHLVGAVRHTFGPVPVVFAHMPPIHEFPAFPTPLRPVLSGLVRLHGDGLRREVARHDDVWFVDGPVPFAEAVAASDPPLTRDDFFCDGVHPSALSYRLWAEDLARYVLDVHALRARLEPAAG